MLPYSCFQIRLLIPELVILNENFFKDAKVFATSANSNHTI